MDHWNRIVIAITLLLACSSAGAGTVDLDLRATLTPPAPYQPGQTVRLLLTVTNFGPAIAGGDVVTGVVPPVQISAAVRINDASRLPLLFESRDPLACPIELVPLDPSPGEREGIIYVVYLPRMAVGEIRTCELDAHIDISQQSTIATTWRVSSLLDSDPSPANNSQLVVFSIAIVTRQIPATGRSVLVMLGLLAALLAARAIRSPLC